eukprot:TRINITY_DN1765_c0_g1_i4.p2 TRINITY_DN1765_c0_g1~~TRINITY_DN1765_c0_g1_i4.p2  ORF type:complete len:113 (-),score=5.76 TRINITY_DN1765_c0_g1_i4:351-689(-)
MGKQSLWESIKRTSGIIRKKKKQKNKESRSRPQMDPLILYHKAEQRCKPHGCKVMNCMKQGTEPQRCNELLKVLRECIAQEKDKILAEHAAETQRKQNEFPSIFRAKVNDVE